MGEYSTGHEPQNNIVSIIIKYRIYILILDPDYHTLVDTSFKLISDFFHVNQGVLCCEHAEQAGGGGATGLLNKGGGSNRLPVEFPQVQTSKYNYFKMFSVTCYNHYFVNSLIICPDN